jgi:Arc/MetJ family transcription regulator
MRTTIDIDEKLLKEVARVTGEKRKSKAVNKALQSFLRQEQLQRLLSLMGKIDLVDNWREMEELELEDQRRLEKEYGK